MAQPKEEPETKSKRRGRRPKPQVQYPVEATVWLPGQKTPKQIVALWVQREPGRTVFGLPETERPYLQRRLEIYESPGLVMEILQIAQQPQPQSIGWSTGTVTNPYSAGITLTANNAAPAPAGPQLSPGPLELLRQREAGAGPRPVARPPSQVVERNPDGVPVVTAGFLDGSPT